VRSIVNHIPNGYFRLQKIRIIGRSQCWSRIHDFQLSHIRLKGTII